MTIKRDFAGGFYSRLSRIHDHNEAAQFLRDWHANEQPITSVSRMSAEGPTALIRSVLSGGVEALQTFFELGGNTDSKAVIRGNGHSEMMVIARHAGFDGVVLAVKNGAQVHAGRVCIQQISEATMITAAFCQLPANRQQTEYGILTAILNSGFSGNPVAWPKPGRHADPKGELILA